MIEISISRELADESPAFMASCAAEGRHVQVFDGAADASDPLNRQPTGPIERQATSPGEALRAAACDR